MFTKEVIVIVEFRDEKTAGIHTQQYLLKTEEFQLFCFGPLLSGEIKKLANHEEGLVKKLSLNFYSKAEAQNKVL